MQVQIIDRSGESKLRHLAGWRKDKEDPRDYKMLEHPDAPKLTSITPVVVDNSPQCSGVEDQGELGACTAHGFADVMEYNQIKWLNVPPANVTRVSRLAEYYYTRWVEGGLAQTKQDSGAQIRDAIKAGVTYGVGREDLWPYDITKFTREPTFPERHDQNTHKIGVGQYFRVNDGDLATIKKVLASGYILEFGFVVYSSFQSQQMATSGILYYPQPGEQVVGGHAVAIVGYNDDQQRVLCKNSWGLQWGLVSHPGYFSMPYEYIQDPNLANDFWYVTANIIP